MKLTIELTPEGMAALAQKEDLYTWHFRAFASTNRWQKPDSTAYIVASVEAEMPPVETCVQAALERLDQKEKTLRDELNEHLEELRNERSKLLCLTA